MRVFVVFYLFLEENGLLEYDALAARAAAGTARFNELSGTIKRAEGRMAEIATLQKLPTMKTLQAECAEQLAEKKKAYAEYAAAKKEI